MSSRPVYTNMRNPTREPLNCTSTGQFFRDGKMNRDGHGTPNPEKPTEGFGSDGKTIKTVHVYHYRNAGER